MTDTIGAQLTQPDPRGWLVFDHLPAEIQRAEDATAWNDYERSRRHGFSLGYPGPRFLTRAATDTERALLAHLGFTVPDGLVTRVEYVSPSVRNRRFPELEN